jgi:hypothetical protein
MKDVKLNIQVDSNADKATKSLEGLEKEVKKLQDAYKKTAIGSEEFKKIGKELDSATGQLSKHQKGLNSMGEAYKKLGGQIPLLTAAQQALNFVMEANPVGLVVAALAGLIGIMKQNAEVADKLEFAMAGVNKAIRFVADQIVQLIKNVANFDLSAIIDQITGFHKGLAMSAVEGYQAAEAQDELQDSIAETTLAISKNNNAIEKNKTLLKDKTKSDAQRKAAAQEIISLENKNAKMTVDNAKKALEAYKLEINGVAKKGEEKIKLAQLEADIDDARTQEEALTSRAKIRLAELTAKEVKVVDTKAKDEAIQREKDYRKQVEDLSNEYLLTDRQKLEKQYNDKIELIRGTTMDELMLIAEIQAARDKAIEDYDYKLQLERLKKAEDDRQADEDANAQLQLNGQLQADIRKQFKLTDEQIDAEFEAMRLANSRLTDQEILKSILDRHKAEAEAGDKAVKEDKKRQEEKFNNARALTGAVADLANTLVDFQSANAKRGSEAEKKAAKNRFKINKASGIVTAGINVAESITKAMTAGPIVGQILAGVSAAIGIAQIAAIAAKQFNPESDTTPSTPAPSISMPSMPSSGGGLPGAPNAGQSFDLGLNAVLKGPEYNMQRVYVTETDISRVQGKVKVVETRSTLN